MTKKELKEILKPLIKEIIKEVILEPGALSTVIKEVMSVSTDSKTIVENKVEHGLQKKKVLSEKIDKQKEQRKKLLDKIGIGSIDGLNPFSGTQPLTESQVSNEVVPGPLSGIDPNDEGVDTSQIINLMGGMRKFNIKE